MSHAVVEHKAVLGVAINEQGVVDRIGINIDLAAVFTDSEDVFLRGKANWIGLSVFIDGADAEGEDGLVDKFLGVGGFCGLTYLNTVAGDEVILESISAGLIPGKGEEAVSNLVAEVLNGIISDYDGRASTIAVELIAPVA